MRFSRRREELGVGLFRICGINLSEPRRSNRTALRLADCGYWSTWIPEKQGGVDRTEASSTRADMHIFAASKRPRYLPSSFEGVGAFAPT